MTSTFTARATAAVFSEVKFVCVRIPPFPRVSTLVRHYCVADKHDSVNIVNRAPSLVILSTAQATAATVGLCGLLCVVLSTTVCTSLCPQGRGPSQQTVSSRHKEPSVLFYVWM